MYWFVLLYKASFKTFGQGLDKDGPLKQGLGKKEWNSKNYEKSIERLARRVSGKIWIHKQIG